MQLPHPNTFDEGPPTGIICLENTLHGCVMPLQEIQAISQLAKGLGITHYMEMHSIHAIYRSFNIQTVSLVVGKGA